jgi:hypothetical protein
MHAADCKKLAKSPERGFSASEEASSVAEEAKVQGLLMTQMLRIWDSSCS